MVPQPLTQNTVAGRSLSSARALRDPGAGETEICGGRFDLNQTRPTPRRPPRTP